MKFQIKLRWPVKVSSLRLKVYRLQHTDTLVGWQLLIDDLDSFIKQPSGRGFICGMRATRRLRCIWVDVSDVGEYEREACIVRSIVELASFACIHMSQS